MKRIIFCCILLAAAVMVPIKKIDISDLEPIQIVRMDRQEGSIILETDTGDVGKGENVQAALNQLKKVSSGIVYLDTAEYLVVTDYAKAYIGHIKPFLKNGVRVCLWNGTEKIKDAAKYMKAHKNGVRIKNWSMETVLPSLPDMIE